jgi:hypothetical protein
MSTPAVVAHCDWSKIHNKRWMSVAIRSGHKFVLSPPQEVLATSDLLDRLSKRRQEGGPLLVGFDFPIGVPAAYGELTGFPNFPTALITFGQGSWVDWFEPAEREAEISIYRPFYPARSGPAGAVKKQHLTEALGVSVDQLLRRCERAIRDQQGVLKQRAACALFWTIGGNQVGKAAIAGWRNVIVPALSRLELRTALWPFDGDLASLLDNCDCVLCETYPALAYRHLGFAFAPGESKSNWGHRQTKTLALHKWFDAHHIELTGDVAAQIEIGFGDDAVGEDRFDAFVGLLDMINVVTGQGITKLPDDPDIVRWEGWIFGRSF